MSVNASHWLVPCPTCGALIGDLCVTGKGRTRKRNHLARGWTCDAYVRGFNAGIAKAFADRYREEASS